MRRFLLASVVTFLVLAIALLSGGCSTAKKSAEKSKPADIKGKTINYLFLEGHDLGPKNLIKQFEEKTGAKVNLIPVGFGDLFAKMGTEFASGGSSYDLVDVAWEPAQGYARAGYFLPLDDLIQKYDVSMDHYTRYYIKNYMNRYPEEANGDTIGLPYVADVQTLAYRKDWFEDPTEKQNFKAKYGHELKVPETYDELLDVAKFFTRDLDGDGKNDRFGIVIMGKNFPATVGDVTPYLEGFGGGWIDEDYKPIINKPESVKAIQYFFDLYAKDKVTPPGVPTYAWDEERADFNAGKVAMIVDWTGGLGAIKLPDSGFAKIGYAVVPGKSPIVGGWQLSIPKKAKEKEAAFQLAVWLTNRENALARAKAGAGAATEDVFTDPDIVKDAPYYPAVKANYEVGKKWPQVTEIFSIWELGAREVSRVFSGELSAQEAADNMAAEIEKAFREAGYYDKSE